MNRVRSFVGGADPLGRARLLAAIATLAIARPSAAQVRLELTSLLGSYAPTQYVVSSSTGWTLRQDAGAILGGAVTLWLTKWLGVEGSAGYSFLSGATYPNSEVFCDTALSAIAPAVVAPRRAAAPTMQSQCDLGFAGAASATGYVRMVSGRVVLDVPVAATTSVYLDAGVASVSHGGYHQNPPLYASSCPDCASLSVAKATNQGLVVGAGARVKLKRTPLTVRAEVLDYHYSVQLTLLPQSAYGVIGPKVQNDLVVSLGLSLQLFGGHPTTPRARTS